ncbi:MAG: hypothetical protein IK006_05015 [Bacteroidaceae bacterium]|nr:hypothetical protein [Bacteroidaceae bacterium]
MNRLFSFFAPLIITSLFLGSCHEVLTESSFEELEIKDQNGTVRKGGLYLPLGYDSKNEYPVIYMADGLVFKDGHYRTMVDSLIRTGSIRPVVIACSYENKKQIPGFTIAYRNAEYIDALSKSDPKLKELFDLHMDYFINSFIPYIEKRCKVSRERDNRVFYGTSNSGDFGLTLSMKHPELMSEYWCFSPVYSDMDGYGMLGEPTEYRICWGLKEEVGQEDYFPALVKSIRKRGGYVKEWSFDGGHDREWWKLWFAEELKRRFPLE